MNIIFRYLNLYHFSLFVFMRLLWLLCVVIIHYPQIGNVLILNVFKNNSNRFLVFYTFFENIM
jgi:hypothetical protein